MEILWGGIFLKQGSWSLVCSQKSISIEHRYSIESFDRCTLYRYEQCKKNPFILSLLIRLRVFWAVSAAWRRCFSRSFSAMTSVSLRFSCWMASNASGMVSSWLPSCSRKAAATEQQHASKLKIKRVFGECAAILLKVYVFDFSVG